jgi:peptidoglycan/xylan/chitin deacetylase (PgdA/CDA1 family)
MTEFAARADVVGHAEHVARADLATFATERADISGLELATFAQAGVFDVVSRRALLAVRVPPRWLSAVSPPLTAKWDTGWTRWLNNYAYWHTVQQQLGGSQTWHRLVRGPLVLLYHAIGSSAEPASRFVLPVRRFEQHMRWLRARRYHVLSLEELLDYWQRRQLPPPRSVVVTLDDAYADAYTNAFPVLARLRIPASFFVVTRRIGGCNDWEPGGPLAGRPLATAAQLGLMRDGGMRLGAHSRTHPSLLRISREQAEDEIVGARADFEQLFATPAATFAYPFGHNTTEVQGIVRQAGYAGACDVVAAVADPWVSRFAIPRVELHGTWRLLHLALALWLGHVPRVLVR